MNQVDPLYQIEVKCTFCEQTFKTSRVRPSFKKSASRDSDFCVHYKDPEYNPDYYVVRVCPYCGFSTTENSKINLLESHKRKYNLEVAEKWELKDFGGKRSWEDALQTYKLALLCAQIVEESERVKAGLLHHIAWLYRYKGDQEQETRFITYARDAYIRVFEKEAGKVNQARLMYLIGDLNRRLQQYSEAVKWFSRVINDKSIMDSAMIQASREQWGKLREEMHAKKMELPEEMQQ